MEKKDLKRRILAGETLQKIATFHGVSKQTVHRWCKKHRIKINKKMPETKRVITRFTEKHYQALEKQSKDNGISISDMVRKIVLDSKILDVT